MAATISLGTEFGTYHIDAVLGEGGMGCVYRATDTNLHRTVAVKFLSDGLDASARQRFQREAQMASSLNHPHILTVHDAGTFAGREYIVTEFVDGGTLADWVAADRRTWRQIVELLSGVADGLSTAHKAGILHRDIKPGNILVSKSGYAKLADFGLAKLADSGSAGHAEAMTEMHTKAGVIVGTVAYMSPEQIAGRPLDPRCDVFAFGIVVYEMLAGCRPFIGASDLEILHTVMHGTPRFLGPDVPVPLRAIVEKALEKDPADRYQSMADFVVDLRRVLRLSTAGEAPQTAAAVATPRQRGWMIWAAVVALALVAGWFAGRALGPRAAVTPTTASAPKVLFRRITDVVGMEEQPAISPDGKTVAFVAPANGHPQVWVRLLAGGAALQLTHDDADHSHPRWTPDSSALIYFSRGAAEGEQGTLWEMAALGGTPRRIASSLGQGDISHDGQRIVTFQLGADRKAVVLAILSRDGSRVERVTPVSLAAYDTPRWSPDDRWLAFGGSTFSSFLTDVYVMSVPDGEPKAVVRGSSIQGIAWLPDGSGLVFASSAGSTMAYPPIFNLRTVSRDAVDERQLTFGDVSYVEPDLVAEGKLFASRIRMQSDIWKFPIDGSPADNVKHATRITQQTGQVQTPSASPDGQQITYLSDNGGHVNVWVAAVDGSSTRQITFETDPAVVIGLPLWSPAGDQIVFIKNPSASGAEWLIKPDGSGLHELAKGAAAASWTADGQSIYYMTVGGADGAANCINRISVNGGSPVRIRCQGGGMAISRDGSTLYYSPEDGKRGEIQKAQPPDGPAQLLARFATARTPLWPNGFTLSPDDRWLAALYRDAGTTNIWAYATDTGSIRQLTDFGSRPILIARRVSWAPDSRSIYASVVETDADIVLLDGIVPSRREALP